MMLKISGDLVNTEDLEDWLAKLDLGAAFGRAKGYDPT